jgi:hypothetical protein
MTEVQIATAKEMYDTGACTFVDIARELNVDDAAVSRHLKKLGCIARYRRYYVNENYFDTIGPNQAYIFGLLLADGCNAGVSKIILGLKQSDSDVLEMIRNEIQPDKPLHNASNEHARKKGWMAEDQLVLSISCKKIHDRLESLGIVRNKTKTASYPAWIDKALTRHFLRGLFDGDGWFGITNCSLSGAEGLLSGVSRLLKAELDVHCCVSKSNGYGDWYRELKIGGRHQVARFYEFLEAEGGLSIGRKREVRLEAIREHLDPTYRPNRLKESARLCTENSCSFKHFARGLCKKHYDHEKHKRKMAERNGCQNA